MIKKTVKVMSRPVEAPWAKVGGQLKDKFADMATPVKGMVKKAVRMPGDMVERAMKIEEGMRSMERSKIKKRQKRDSDLM